MDDDGKRRAATYAAEQAARQGLSVPGLALRAKIDPATVRDFLDGVRWPRSNTRQAIEDALGLGRGTFELVARGLADTNEDEVERAIKSSALSRANQHRLLGAYYDMLEGQETTAGGGGPT